MQMSRNMNCIPSGQNAVNLSSIQCRSFSMPCGLIRCLSFRVAFAQILHPSIMQRVQSESVVYNH